MVLGVAIRRLNSILKCGGHHLIVTEVVPIGSSTDKSGNPVLVSVRTRHLKGLELKVPHRSVCNAFHGKIYQFRWSASCFVDWEGFKHVLLTRMGVKHVLLTRRGVKHVLLTGRGLKHVLLTRRGFKHVLLTRVVFKHVLLTKMGVKHVLLTGRGFKHVLLTGWGFKHVLLTGWGFKHVLLTGWGVKHVLLIGTTTTKTRRPPPPQKKDNKKLVRMMRSVRSVTVRETRTTEKPRFLIQKSVR